jgi:hypothetical protein
VQIGEMGETVLNVAVAVPVRYIVMEGMADWAVTEGMAPMVVMVDNSPFIVRQT